MTTEIKILTDEDISAVLKAEADAPEHRTMLDFARAIEQAALQSQERDDAEFELLQDDTVMASTSGKREDAWREIQHYAAVYSQDGPVEIYEVIRRRIEGVKDA